MSYVKATYSAGNLEYQKKYHTGRKRLKGEKRNKRSNPTKVTVQNVNKRRCAELLRLKLNANFYTSDWLITLNYGKTDRSRTVEQMKKDIGIFTRRLRNKYNAHGERLRFIYALSAQKGACPHVSLVINDIGIGSSTIAQMWEYGKVRAVTVGEADSSGTFDSITELLFSEGEKTKTVNKQRYSCSRNLIEPLIRIEEIEE